MSSYGNTPPVIASQGSSNHNENCSPSIQRRTNHGSQASTERQAKISSTAAELSSILEASPNATDKGMHYDLSYLNIFLDSLDF